MDIVHSVIEDIARGVMDELLIASVIYDDDKFILTDDFNSTIDLNL